ncbi:MAG: hypothetical protein IT566_05830 [Rhodospirillaceae bacterium]|nr:hypothetical protein [Rhodospirillaceae bacterium]
MQKKPNVDHYDPAPYDALATVQRSGEDVSQRINDLIIAAHTRPGFIAKRLNRAGLRGPSNGLWTWKDTYNVQTKYRAQLALVNHTGSSLFIGSGGGWRPRW